MCTVVSIYVVVRATPNKQTFQQAVCNCLVKNILKATNLTYICNRKAFFFILTREKNNSICKLTLCKLNYNLIQITYDSYNLESSELEFNREDR